MGEPLPIGVPSSILLEDLGQFPSISIQVATARAQSGGSDGSPPPWDGKSLNPRAGEAVGRGFNAPLRFDASIDDCEVVGQVPTDMDGAFYRVGGEFYWPMSMTRRGGSLRVVTLNGFSALMAAP